MFILSLPILVSTPCLSQNLNESSDEIWTVGPNRWTVEEEYRFGKWVDENITEDFFIRYRTPTDCADAVYAIRWIYARIAHLPAAATAKDGKLIGHWSTKWKHLPTHPEWQHDQRFHAALLYILRETSTRTLPLDTYPIRISPDSVTPGTVLCMTESHCGIVGHVCCGRNHPLQTWESMLPVKVRKLVLRTFFSSRPERKTNTGLVKFRWPILENGRWKYLPVKEHPFYSEEQYKPSFYEGYEDFVEAVSRRIDPTDYQPMEKMVNIIGTITRLLRERVPIVLAGHQQCSKGGCPEGWDLWEVHNTVGYDGMINLLMDDLSKVIRLHHLDYEMVEKMMKAISIDISKDRSITFYDIYQNCSWLSSHPKDSIEARWGLRKCAMIQAQIHTARDSIAFVETIYGKKDPKYAEFSIHQQEEILRRLNEQLTESECHFAARVR
ncbi:MAG: hypothetical protein ACXU97_10305 [Thermodesulfobacteriota bacterium]